MSFGMKASASFGRLDQECAELACVLASFLAWGKSSSKAARLQSNRVCKLLSEIRRFPSRSSCAWVAVSSGECASDTAVVTPSTSTWSAQNTMSMGTEF